MQKLQINEKSLFDAEYRFWDPSKCFLDYNQDGFIDMFAFLTNFKDAPYGSKFGKYILVDDVLGTSPKIKVFDANRRFMPRLKTMDLNKDGVFEVLFSAEDDHMLLNGTFGSPSPIQFAQISKSGDIIFKEIGESVSIHGQGFGDIDNDGDIEFIVHKKINQTENSVQIVELTTNKDEALYKGNISIIASALFDGRYSFDISRYNEKDGSKTLGNGFIKIQNGIMTVERENRTLLNGTVDLYDTFEGKIDKKGNINSSLKISALFGESSSDLENVNLLGNIDELLKGPWDDYYDIIVKLEKIL